MNIVVTLKQTFDTETNISISDGKINDAGVKLVINPYDEFAIEEALKLKEEFGGEVTLVSVGGPGIETALRTGLAMGADKAVLIQNTDLTVVDEVVVAEILAKQISSMPYDIILSGRIDTDYQASQVAVRLAEILEIPSVSSLLKLEFEGEKAVVVREMDGGAVTLEVTMPALFTCQKGLNEPRLPNMKGIMMAKKKEILNVPFEDLGLDAEKLVTKSEVTAFNMPEPRSAGKVIPGEAAEAAAELARILREEAKVI